MPNFFICSFNAHDNGQCSHIFVVHGVLFLFLATWMKSPPSIQSFSFISSSNFVHMVHHILRLPHAWPLPLCTAPTQSEPVCLPTSAAAGAWLAAIYRHFWKEAGNRVPRSPSVYTHTAAGSNWVNEGESGGARECGFSALHPHIPAAFPRLCFHSLVLPWTSGQLFSHPSVQSPHCTDQWTVCLQWILLRQAA